MSWRIFLTDSSQPDLDALTDSDRATLWEELLTWVDTDPPRANRRIVAGAELFEDRLPSGIFVTYFVNEEELHVAVLRVRRH